MEQFFTASDTGVAGAAMMTSTASVQVNLDAGPRDGWADRVRLAHALGPDDDRDRRQLAAAERRVHRLAFEPAAGVESARTRRAAGPILGASGDDPGTDWARYALKAPVMLVHDPGRHAVPVTHRVPFADWADGRVLLGGRRPTRRPGLPPDHAVPAGAAAAVAGDPLPGQRARRESGPRWCSPWSRCSTTRSPPTSPPRPSNRSRRPGTPRPGSGSATGGCYAAANRCVAIAAERAPAELAEAMQRLVAAVEQGRCPADDFSDRVIENGIAAAVDRAGARGAVTSREALVARSDPGARTHAAAGRFRRRRTPPPVRPADEPAGVGPGAHRPAGRAVAAARRRPRSAGNAAAARSKASTTRSCTPAPAASTCRCCRRTEARTYCRDRASGVARRARRTARRRRRARFRLRLVVSHENQHDETMLQALNLRTGPPLLLDGAARCRRAGRAWPERRCWCPAARSCSASTRADEPYLAGQRTAGARRRRAGVPHRPRPGHQRRMAAVHRRRRLPRSRAGGRSAAGSTARSAGLTAPQFWNADGQTRTRFGHVEDIPADEPVQHVTLLRGRGLRGVGRRAAAHRGGMGEGLRLGPAAPARGAAIPWGARNRRRRSANLGGDALRPAPVGAYPGGRVGLRRRADARRRVGVDHLAAAAVAGLHPDDLRAVLASRSSSGDYKVLRGGVVGGGVGILRPSFRNWDHPIRRQIFSGVRLWPWDVPDVPAPRLAGRDRARSPRWCSTRRTVCWCSRMRRAGRSTG